MVQLLEELPPELQAHIAGTLDDAAAAGQWAQASRASRLLLLPRLDQLLEARCHVRQQAMLDKLSRPRRGAAAALSVYHMGDAAMLQSVCWLAIWTGSLVCAALETVSFKLATARAAPQRAAAPHFQAALGKLQTAGSWPGL